MKQLQTNLEQFPINDETEYSNYFKVKEKNNYNVLDLFCGCGGLSLGFQRAGFNIIAGVDFDNDSLISFQENLNAPSLKIDLFNEKWIEAIPEKIKNKKIDIIVGGPPCQGFSLTGTRIFDDPRNILYKSFFDAIEHFSPSIVLIENVKGMSTLYKGEAKRQILIELEKREYLTSSKVLNSANFGVPQVRERLFILGKKGSAKLKIPDELLHKDNYVSCSTALSDLPSLSKDLGNEEMGYENGAENYFQLLIREGSNRLFNHVGTNHKPFVIDTIRQVPDGGNYKDLPKGVGISRKFNEAWTRYNSKKPSRTIDTGHRNHFHYKYNRVPTVRENARLQTFPDTFKFYGSKTSQNRQVGNAVPVFLSQSLALCIKEDIKQ